MERSSWTRRAVPPRPYSATPRKASPGGSAAEVGEVEVVGRGGDRRGDPEVAEGQRAAVGTRLGDAQRVRLPLGGDVQQAAVGVVDAPDLLAVDLVRLDLVLDRRVRRRTQLADEA